MIDNLNTGEQPAAEPQSGAPGDDAEHAPGKLNDAVIYGDLDGCAFLQQGLSIAYGKDREDKNWINEVGTGGQLIGSLCTFTRSDVKDGRAMLEGKCVTPLAGKRGTQRTARNQHTNYAILLDNDTGEPIKETVAKIKTSGLFAVIWTTYSHGKPQSAIRETALLKWMQAKERGDKPTAQDAADYLQETKNTRPEIFIDAALAGREHINGGVHYILRHAPMARTRIMFLLEKAYVFGDRPGLTHDQAMEDWKSAYAAVAQKIGVAYDTSCVDPSRLMYLPRIPMKAVIGDGPYDHQIIVIAGKPLDLDAVERVVAAKKAEKKPKASTSNKNNGTETRSGGKEWLSDPNFGKWWHKHGPNLNGPRYVEKEWERAESRDKEKAEVVGPCVFADNHTEETDPLSMYTWSAKDGQPAGASCQHGGCKAHTSAEFYDAMAAKLGHTLAYLTENYVERSQEEIDTEEAEKATRAADRERLEKELKDARKSLKAWEPAEKTGKNEKKLATAVKAIAKCKNNKERKAAVDKVLRAQATQDNWSDRKLVAAVDELADIGVGILGKQVKGYRDEYQAAKARPAYLEEALKGLDIPAEDVVEVDAGEPVPFPPSDPDEYDGVIVSYWDQPLQLAIAKSQIRRKNTRKPELFTRVEGGALQLAEIDGHLKLDELSRDKWANKLAGLIRYRKITKETDRLAGIPDELASPIRGAGARELGLNVIDRVVDVPLFGPDMKLRVEDGYDAATRCYLKKSFEVRVPSVAPCDEEVRQAREWLLLEVFRDFPFTDHLDGREDEPTHIGRDAKGHRLPFLWRGRASRANACAMIIQPFVRNVIDGPTPGYHIGKPERGTGAGYLAATVFSAIDGTGLVQQTMAKENEEFRKAITATIRAGENIIFVDNINRHVDSADLASALTTGTWMGRVLGLSEMVKIPVRAEWLLAGNNNFSLSDELRRRMVPVFMDAKTKNPSRDRSVSDFKHSPYLSWLLANRAKTVWAIHTLVQNWIAKGCAPGSAQLASFDSYASVMSGILETAGIPGFLDNTAGYIEADNSGSTEDNRFIAELWGLYKENPFTSSEAIRVLESRYILHSWPYESFNVTRLPEEQKAHAFGKHLGGFRTRTFASGEGFDVTLINVGQCSPVKWHLVRA